MDFVSVRRPSDHGAKTVDGTITQKGSTPESNAPTFVRPVRRPASVHSVSSRDATVPGVGDSTDAHTPASTGSVNSDASVNSGSSDADVNAVASGLAGGGSAHDSGAVEHTPGGAADGVTGSADTFVRTVEKTSVNTTGVTTPGVITTTGRIGSFAVTDFDDTYESYVDGVDTDADSVDSDGEVGVDVLGEDGDFDEDASGEQDDSFDDGDLFDALNDIYDEESVHESITSRGYVNNDSMVSTGGSSVSREVGNVAEVGHPDTADSSPFMSVRSSGATSTDNGVTGVPPAVPSTDLSSARAVGDVNGDGVVDAHDELMDSLLGGDDDADDQFVVAPGPVSDVSLPRPSVARTDSTAGVASSAVAGAPGISTEPGDDSVRPADRHEPAVLASLREVISSAPTLDPGVVAHHERLAVEDEQARNRYWDEVNAANEKLSSDRAKLLDEAGLGDQVKVVKRVPSVSSDSSFSRRDTNEVLVDAHGRPIESPSLKTGKTADDGDRVGGKVSGRDGRSGSRYRYLRPDGKLNGAEMEFFKRAQNAMRGSRNGASLETMMRGPMNTAMEHETEAQRRERSLVIAQALKGKDVMNRNSKLKFSEKDRQTLQFLAAFRYATDAHLAHMFSNSTVTAYNRLHRLREKGLVIDRRIYGARPIWFLTRAGMLVSGMDLPRVTESKITYSMFPHQFTVNNTAANLWGANDNVLNLEEYPAKNQIDAKGNPVFGERLCSELEIQSSLSRLRMGEKAGTFRPELRKKIDLAFAQWERAGGTEFGSSPEMMYGNEFMWSLFPPSTVRLAYHVPDLVVMRDRTPDGKPQSIAVEIEINNKPSERYEKTLLAYKLDTLIYDKVVWVCKSRGPAQKLEQVAKEIGLWQEGRIDIVPVISDGKVFTGRDLWTL